MTKEDIIRMAREAGFSEKHTDVYFDRQLERFAALVAAAEREACAQVCDDIAKETFSAHCQVWGEHFARAIRARENT